MPNEQKKQTELSGLGNPDHARDDLRAVASFLFDDDWREGVARILETDRRSLVRELASDEPIRQDIWLSLSKMVESRLETVWQEHIETLETIRLHLKKHGYEAAPSVSKARAKKLSSRTG